GRYVASRTRATVCTSPEGFFAQFSHLSGRFHCSGRLFVAGCRRSPTSTVARCTVSGDAAGRAPIRPVNQSEYGSARAASWMPTKPPPASMYASRPASWSGSRTSPPPVRNTTALKRLSRLSLVKTAALSVAVTSKRCSAGPVCPIRSIAAIPAFTTGDAAPPAGGPWNGATRPPGRPGGAGRAIVAGGGPGSGRALAAGADISPAATIPAVTVAAQARRPVLAARVVPGRLVFNPLKASGDRKSTRLNSSHVKISYAVFCLKKKNITSCHTTNHNADN